MAEAQAIGAPQQDMMEKEGASNQPAEQPKDQAAPALGQVVAPPAGHMVATAPGQQSMGPALLRVLAHDGQIMHFDNKYWMQVALPLIGYWSVNTKQYLADTENIVTFTRTEAKTTCYCCHTAPTFSFDGKVQGRAFSGTAEFFNEPKPDCCSSGRPAYTAMSIRIQNGEEWKLEMPEIKAQSCDLAGCVSGCCSCGAQCGLECLLGCIIGCCCPCINCNASCCNNKTIQHDPTVTTEAMKLQGRSGRQATIQWAWHFGQVVDVSIDAGSPEDNLALVILPWLVHAFVEGGAKELASWGKAATRVLTTLPTSPTGVMQASEYMSLHLNAGKL